ncbi:MAG: Pectate lyase precursor [Ignavibacteriae bacterium]|nr:MAG: Pectate lyase precursor [Ignavibacteriota bacterium]
MLRKNLNIAILILTIATLAIGQVQLTENWDSGNSIPTSSSSAPSVPTDYNTSSGVWTLFRSYRHGTTYYSAPYALRLLKGVDTAYAITPVLNSVGTVSFYGYAVAPRPIYIFISTNGGSSWIFVDSVSTGNGAFAFCTKTINDPSNNLKLKFQNGTGNGNDINIDNVVITSYTTNSQIEVSTSSLSNFGNLVYGNYSISQSYTVSGTNLTGDLVITSPAGFQISNDNSNFFNSINLTPVGGNVNNTNIYVRFTPTSPSGTMTGEIQHTSAGAATKTVSVSGIALDVEPTQQSNITFGTVTDTSITANFSGGNGARRIIVIRLGNPVTFVPTDGVSPSGVNSNFNLASDQGSGNKIVYDGAGNNVTVTGLSQNTTYHFAVYEYNVGSNNSHNYLTTSPGTGSQTTLTVPTINVVPASLSFGNVLIGTTSTEKTYQISGTKLNPASGNISVNAPVGFEISLTSGSGFSSSINLPYSDSTLNNTTIYVRFKPTNVQSYIGDITNSGGGAETKIVSVTGNGVPPSAPNEFQAEDAILVSSYIMSDYSGYTGSGYVDMGDKDGSSIEFVFSRATAASDTVSVRYANGASTRSLTIYLNDVNVGTLSFTTTGSWTNWNTVRTVVNLSAGVNRLKFVLTTNAVGPNIDKINISGQLATPMYKLTLLTSGNGTASANPSAQYYEAGTTVTLTATPNSGYSFYRWGGTDESFQNPLNIVMNSHKTQIAVIAPMGGFVTPFPYESSPRGFASVPALGYTQGTTGGKGPHKVYVTSSAQLAELMNRRVDVGKVLNLPPLTVYIVGTLVPEAGVTDKIDIKDAYDISVIGVGSDAGLNGLGFNVVRSKNIIIRNLKIVNAPIDGITIEADDSEGTGNHIWVDHCSISNCYDGALDVTHASAYVTLSWNHFYKHDKTSLVGHSDSQTSDVVMKVTYHHNYFDSTGQRHPRVRYGKVHVFNNYFRKNILYGVSSNCEADVLVEGNYFFNVPIPYESLRVGTSYPGDLVARNNILAGTTGPGSTRGTAFEASTYYSYTLDSPENIPQLITNYVGSGKYDFSYEGAVTPKYVLNVTAVNGTVIKNPEQMLYDSGAVVQLTAIPNTGYHFVNWSGDLSGVSNPTTILMTSNKNVTANFAINQYKIIASSSPNGSITPSDTVVVNYGDSVTFTFTPDTGYHIDSVFVDNVYIGNPVSYKFVNVSSDHRIYVKFAINQYTIIATAGGNGSIIPDGTVIVNYGSDQLFVFVPAQNYQVDSVFVDGVYIGSPANYTFQNVTNNHTIHVRFRQSTMGVSFNVAGGWNLISLPVIVANNQRGVLFPNSISDAYYFDNGYLSSDTLGIGIGYWLKFANHGIINLSGELLTTNQISVEPGWNLIGTISIPVSVSSVSINGSANFLSSFYGYNNGYFVADTLYPGKAYWIKVSDFGQIVIGNSLKSGIIQKMEENIELNFIKFTDNDGNNQKLYFGIENDVVDGDYFELPPLPPRGAFDIRFKSNNKVELYSKHFKQTREIPILLNTISYPVIIDNKLSENENFEYYLVVDRQTYQIRPSERLILYNEPEYVALKIVSKSEIPNSFIIKDNYPNPFNSTTKIEIGLPEESKLSIEIFNFLGQKIADIAKGTYSRGYHTFSWNGRAEDGAELGSGIYLYRVNAKLISTGKTVSEIKKMILLK